MSRDDIREGTFVWKAGDSDHGMVVVEPREDVDLRKSDEGLMKNDDKDIK